MVVIDENDVGKSREQVLMDLIYESTGQRIPLEKVKFSKPLEVDQRRDLATDPNTFIPCQVDQQYDDRYWAQGSGFMYRRRSIFDHTVGIDLNSVRPSVLPFKISDVLDQINDVVPYTIQVSDIIDYEYTTLEQVLEGITLQAHPESLLWMRGRTFQVDTGALTGDLLIQETDLDGFTEYQAP
jgi:hypothetical protein